MTQQVYHSTVDATLYIYELVYDCLFSFILPVYQIKDDSRICVNIQNKDGNEHSRDNTERVNTQKHMYQNK